MGSTINGVDGWTADTAWMIWTNSAGSKVMWNNKGNGETTSSTYRDFAQSYTAGTLTYDLRPNDTDVGAAQWLLLRDSGGSTYALQFMAATASQGQGNTTREFRIFDYGGWLYSPDTNIIQFTSTALYQVKIDFDLANMTGGPNGTFDLQVTRTDGTPQVVWSQSNLGIRNSMSNIGRFNDNGSTATAGFATTIDNIELIPEPGTGLLALAGLLTIVWHRLRRS